MKNKFYSYEWKVNDGEWTSYIMDENWTMIDEFDSCEWKVNNN
jgi:hypothetical protein